MSFLAPLVRARNGIFQIDEEKIKYVIYPNEIINDTKVIGIPDCKLMAQ